MKRIYLFGTLLTVFLILPGCSSKRQLYKRTRFYMGTTAEFSVVYETGNPFAVKKACDLAESRISELDTMLSLFDKSSPVSKINEDEQKSSVNVPEELIHIVQRAKEYFNASEGAFDITVAPLTEMWGFGPDKKALPDQSAIDEALNHVGLDKVGITDDKNALIFKDPKVQLDFGGLAKGFAVDEAVRVLKEQGVANGLVNIGGDLYCLGSNVNGKGWSIGIRDPEDKEKVLAALNISNRAVATSGSYENFYIYQDKKFGHIIDPRSGNTVANSITSATIIADDCQTADAMATAVFVLGKDKGKAAIENLPGVECFLVIAAPDGSRSISMSSGMERFIKRSK